MQKVALAVATGGPMATSRSPSPSSLDRRARQNLHCTPIIGEYPGGHPPPKALVERSVDQDTRAGVGPEVALVLEAGVGTCATFVIEASRRRRHQNSEERGGN